MQLFTKTQYFVAIKSLLDGLRQLEPDGECCSICGSDCHEAFTCGHNPLVAMVLCEKVARQSDKLHDTLHYLAGYDTSFGVTVGPAKVVVPQNRQFDDPR